MRKLITVLSLALFALAGTSAHATEVKKKDEPAAAKPAAKAASATPAKADDKPVAKKKEKKGGC